jgi:hypothetical protein
MDERELKERTRRFAIRCMKLADSLPTNRPSSRTVANQLVRCGHRWVPIIVPHVVRGRARNLLRNWRWLKKRRTKAHFGWKWSLPVK